VEASPGSEPILLKGQGITERIVYQHVTDRIMSEEQAIVFEWDGESPLTEDTPRPIAGSNAIPDWFQKLPTHGESGGSTVKLCASFSDALRAGWIIPLPFDLSFVRGADSMSCVIPDSDAEATVYGSSDAESSKNSSFRKPELKIPNPWKIHTPDGYSTLVTYPRNREDDGIKPYSMFVDTDSYDGRINIPVSTTQTRADIPAGVPFVQVIPLKRDAILSDFDVTDESESPGVHKLWHETHSRAMAEDGYYRRYCWEPKAATTLEDYTGEEDFDSQHGSESVQSLTGSGKEQSAVPEPDHTPKLFISDELSGIVPNPFPMTEMVPKWITDPAELSVNGEDEEKFRTWAHDLLRLGWNVPIVSDTIVRVSGNDIDLHSEFQGTYKRGEWHDVGTESIHPSYQVGEKYSSGRPGVAKVTSPWFTITPPEYSVLQCEPFNHRQQYNSSYTGIVETDRYVADANLLGKVDLPDGEYLLGKGEPAISQVAFRRDALLKTGYAVENGDVVEK